MKKFRFSKKFLVILSVLIVIAIGCQVNFTQLTLPTDASSDCNNTITASVFNSWFVSGSVSLDGSVNPANSLTFSPNSLCSFYQWSEQMFLWLTSPAPKTYGGGGGIVINSPAFFDVTPPDSTGQRTFIAHIPGKIRAFNVRTAQRGAHGLPVIVEKKTLRLLEILEPVISKNGRQIILNKNGQEVEIGSVKFDHNKPVLLDVKGNEILGAKAIIKSNFDERSRKFNLGVNDLNDLDRTDLIQQITIFKTPLFFDLSGNVIDVEQGQAGGNAVLMAQNGSLVYYTTITNDVYAYYRTMQGSSVPIPSTIQFPTTQAGLSNITSFGRSHGKTFADSIALAIEVKASWVEAAGLPDSDKFITMEATVPTYDKTNPNDWKPIPNGQKTVLLALVGMHVVGSVAGHPEMLWGTFEHVSNTPDTSYDYSKASGTGTIPMSTTGNWVFCANNAGDPFNIAHMAFDNTTGHITAAPGFSISPSNTLRIRPFGMPGSNASSNAEIITINNSVRSFLINGDLRKNYIQTGTTWTIGGAPPSGSNQVGTNNLANSTMETYQLGSNCFNCHNSNTTDVSHVFSHIQPLF